MELGKKQELELEAKRFFESYKKEIGKSLRGNEHIVKLDFDVLSKFSPMLSEKLIETPEEIISLLEVILSETGLTKNPRIRFETLPESSKIKIKEIRAKNLDQFIAIEGIVRQASDVRPQVVNARFECPTCGAILSVLQIDRKFREPSRCSCGRKGLFKLLSKEMVDAQRLVIEESPDSLEGGEQPRRMNVFLKEDLVDPKMEDRTTPGSKVRIIGVLKEVPVPLPQGSISTRFDLAVEANNAIPLEETFDDLEVNDIDEENIKKIANDPKAFEKLASSIAPSVYGFKEVKEAILLQLFSGVKKKRSDGGSTRGDIHILLVGDPGVAKSVTLKFVARIAPKGRYVSGKAATGAGLTAAVVKDEFLKGWSLEAGAMVLANKGTVCLHPDSNIIINNQIKPIGSLFKEEDSKKYISNKETIEVCEIDGTITSAEENKIRFINKRATLLRRKNYVGDLITFNFESGLTLSLTPDHKIIDGNTLEWKEAQDFKEEEFALGPLKVPENNHPQYLLEIIPSKWFIHLDKEEKNELKTAILTKYSTITSFNKIYDLDSNYLSGGKQLNVGIFKKIINDLGIESAWKERTLSYGRSKASEKLKIAKITPEISYLIGFILGDGHCRINEKHSSIEIVQSTKNKKQIDKIKEMFAFVSQRSINEYKRKMISEIRGKKVESECLSLNIHSNLIAYLYYHFTKDELSNILSLPNECLKAFFAGCMDSDGCISIKTGKKSNVEYQTAHVEFLLTKNDRINKNLVLALRRLDCYAKSILKKTVNKIMITGREDVITLLNEIKEYSIKIKEIPERIKLISSASQKLPQEIVSQICTEIIEGNKDKKELNELGISSILYDYKNKKIQPARDQLRKIRDKLQLSNIIQNKISMILERDFFIDKIIKINKEKYSGYVYDLFVPENHNYFCEGIVVHNCIDEIEKMDEHDRSTMHESLEQQTVTISKANIQATLRSETSVLAAGNPKLGRFDPLIPIPQQINISPALLSRFDVIFILRDLPNRVQDEAIARHVLEEHQQDVVRDVIDPKLLRKYIAYARKKVKPKLTDEAAEEIREFYITIRNKAGSSSSELKPIPITARQLEAIVRLSEACAKVRLSNFVTVDDTRRAIKLLKYSMMQVGYDEETQSFDIDRVTTGIPTSKRNKIITVREAISRLESSLGKLIPVAELEKELGEKLSKEKR